MQVFNFQIGQAILKLLSFVLVEIHWKYCNSNVCILLNQLLHFFYNVLLQFFGGLSIPFYI